MLIKSLPAPKWSTRIPMPSWFKNSSLPAGQFKWSMRIFSVTAAAIAGREPVFLRLFSKAVIDRSVWNSWGKGWQRWLSACRCSLAAGCVNQPVANSDHKPGSAAKPMNSSAWRSVPSGVFSRISASAPVIFSEEQLICGKISVIEQDFSSVGFIF